MAALPSNSPAQLNGHADREPQSPNPQSEIWLGNRRGDPSPQSHPTLPSLSPDDERLLESYLRLNFNLDLLSASSNIPILRLIRWLNLPHIQQYLQALDTLRARQSQAESASDRRTALDALKQVLAETQDPTEKRRAATAILRALNARPQRSPTDPSPNQQSETPSLPRPRRTPSPLLSADQTLRAALRALANAHNEGDDDSGLATLHAFCAKGATLDGKPVPQDLADFLDDLDDQTREHLAITTVIGGKVEADTPTAYRTRNVQLCREGSVTLADIELRRDSPDHPFLIHSIALRDTS